MKKILLFFFVLPIFLFSIITENELQELEAMLNSLELTSDSLNFPKDWASSEFKIPIMIEILENPLRYPLFIDTVKNYLLKEEIISFYQYSFNLVFERELLEINSETLNDSIPDFLLSSSTSRLLKQIPIIRTSKDLLKYVEKIYMQANDYYIQTFASLTPTELDFLQNFLFSLGQGGEEDTEKYHDFFSSFGGMELEEAIDFFIVLIKKVHFASLIKAGHSFQNGMYVLSQTDLSHLKFEKRVEYSSHFGLMVVGTKHNDVYSKDYSFIYDPDGNDQYVGNISTHRGKPFCAIFDLAGDDLYQNNKLGQLFTAMFGHIMHFDQNGNDTYLGDDFSFSANMGSLLSIDLAGNDVYRAGSRSLGAATCGLAFLVNQGGNDYYSGTCYTQGFGGPLGLALLADMACAKEENNDVYVAGGIFKHPPLVPNDHLSLAQGCGMGLRPDIAGGIGILFDQSGNDKYLGEVYAQGVAYWYALGILIDLEGNDVYNAVYYPQGSGIHIAAGFLYDERGDDSYYSRFGPGQGAGHDYGVGFLVDKAGNDHYSVDGGNGLGISNSVGVFIDSEGNDRYERKLTNSYGHGGTARNSGSIGLFLDLGGHDEYVNEYMVQNGVWTSGYYGIGKDIESIVDEEHMVSQIEQDKYYVLDDTLKIEELFSLAAEWEVGNAVEQVRTAREKLLERVEEAVPYIHEKKLMTKSGLELRAIEYLVHNSELMKSSLSKGLNHDHPRAVNNTIYLIGQTRDQNFLDAFRALLNNNKYVNSILSVLGNFESDLCLDLLESYLSSDDVYRRTIVARSLKEINSERSIKLLLSLGDDENFLIESMINQINRK